MYLQKSNNSRTVVLYSAAFYTNRDCSDLAVVRRTNGQVGKQGASSLNRSRIDGHHSPCSSNLTVSQIGPLPVFFDANGKDNSTLATLKMPIRIFLYLDRLELIVCENFDAPVIHSAYYCYWFVEEIWSHANFIIFDICTTVAIVRCPLRSATNEPKILYISENWQKEMDASHP